MSLEERLDRKEGNEAPPHLDSGKGLVPMPTGKSEIMMAYYTKLLMSLFSPRPCPVPVPVRSRERAPRRGH